MEYNEAELLLLKNPDIEIHKIKTHSPEWFYFRRTMGIGSSETATVLGGMHEYETPAKLFHEKIGNLTPEAFDNPPMFWGRTHEPQIAKVWEYYDGTPDGYMSNMAEDRIIRRNFETGYITNKNYPWLFSSPDRLIMPPFMNLNTGEMYETIGNLEIKTLSYHAAKKWESKVPIYYIAQVHQQMIVMNTEYSEIAILRDGNKLDVLPIEMSQGLRDRILEETHNFWYKKVVPGRELQMQKHKFQAAGRHDLALPLLEKIDLLEPDPDSSKAYEEFMDKRFVDNDDEIIGDLKDLQKAKEYNWYLGAEAVIKSRKQAIKNYFIRKLQLNSVSAINVNDRGYVRYGVKGSNMARTLTVNYPVKPSKIVIEKQITKIDKKF